MAYVKSSILVEVEMAFEESAFELITGHPTISRPPGTHEIEWHWCATPACPEEEILRLKTRAQELSRAAEIRVRVYADD